MLCALGKQVKQVELCSGEVKLLQIRKETRNKMRYALGRKITLGKQVKQVKQVKLCSGEVNLLKRNAK
ncbi:MAG TPA: hypothetical protein P5543_06255 [Planctomycetota bacterium]|nr:hypothetical protein [Planctomycetota bacterium]HRU51775.1 hypothetical protein [Planctomycetota bacterium]